MNEMKYYIKKINQRKWKNLMKKFIYIYKTKKKKKNTNIIIKYDKEYFIYFQVRLYLQDYKILSNFNQCSIRKYSNIFPTIVI